MNCSFHCLLSRSWILKGWVQLQSNFACESLGGVKASPMSSIHFLEVQTWSHLEPSRSAFSIFRAIQFLCSRSWRRAERVHRH